MDPCGTTEVTLTYGETCPFIFTACCLFDKYEMNHRSRLPLIPLNASFCINIRWSTLSNAFLKSVYIASTCYLESVHSNTYWE